MAEYMHIPIIILIAWCISYLCKRIFTVLIDRGVETLKIEATNYYFIRNGVSFVIYLFSLALIFKMTPGLSGLGTTLFASAGIIAAAVGFAGKEAMSNIVSGIFIIIFKPFRVGDFLELDPQTRGKVEDITMRHTVLADINNRRILFQIRLLVLMQSLILIFQMKKSVLILKFLWPMKQILSWRSK
ncbi:hypothetical protein LNTAR_12201 [Lentisphaera araneosa HTCC2155]|uniref:Mechanosensitive ion channel MscS domain-containing protein n=1 Tax=Lentisphaera araneosa HTCC2155 TaxID=313628 RepID=A6DJP1_9BACT|nr:mechanosensitive ion channel domain-containing protein [Lentisphaera araneosa]EDM28115.1 hypothetical protein LNTAR_12201 [Lentisphaera araneosa HTCC2155]